VQLDRSLRLSEHETALEVGWLLAELEQRFGYGLDELARRFDRSVSWVSRRWRWWRYCLNFSKGCGD
jgi:ParB family chromosome partitioning protein